MWGLLFNSQYVLAFIPSVDLLVLVEGCWCFRKGQPLYPGCLCTSHWGWAGAGVAPWPPLLREGYQKFAGFECGKGGIAPFPCFGRQRGRDYQHGKQRRSGRMGHFYVSRVGYSRSMAQ